MVSALSTSIIHWSSTAILDPINEGIIRINRFFTGVNLHNIDFLALTWQERAVNLLTGLPLLVPILNLVTWVFMRTFAPTQILPKSSHQVPFHRWEAAENELEVFTSSSNSVVNN